MLPVVATGAGSITRRSIAYTWATVACSLVLWPVAGTALVYPVVAAAVGRAGLSGRSTGSMAARNDRG